MGASSRIELTHPKLEPRHVASVQGPAVDNHSGKPGPAGPLPLFFFLVGLPFALGDQVLQAALDIGAPRVVTGVETFLFGT